MKGNPLFPRCGFSAAAVQILQAYGPVHGVDVLSEPEVREGIKEYTRWPTIPQVFIRGKFVGGSDIVRELEERGELKSLITGRAGPPGGAGADDRMQRIGDARMKPRDRFSAKMKAPPGAADDKPRGSGPPNRHGMPQVPVGQHVTEGWPVLDLGSRP